MLKDDLKDVTPVVSSNLLKVLTLFSNTLQLERGLADNTVSAYHSDLLQWLHFLKNNSINSFNEVFENHASDWIRILIEKNYAPSSLLRKLSALKMFGRFLFNEKYCPVNISLLLESPKLSRKLPDVLSTEEVEVLLQAPDISTPKGLRDRAFLELLYSSGLRVSELCELDLTALNLKEGFVRVIGKGSKERMIPIGKYAIDALENYLVSGRPFLVKQKTGGACFLSQWGRAMSRKTIWHTIQKYASKVKIKKRVKPHSFRHSFATHLLSGGADLRSIQEMLGHCDIGTTQIYTHIDRSKLLQEHQNFHPNG